MEMDKSPINVTSAVMYELTLMRWGDTRTAHHLNVTAVTTNFQDDIPHLKYKIYLKVQNVDGFIRHQVVMLLYVSKVPIVVCLTSAGPKILTEVETLGERC